MTNTDFIPLTFEQFDNISDTILTSQLETRKNLFIQLHQFYKSKSNYSIFCLILEGSHFIDPFLILTYYSFSNETDYLTYISTHQTLYNELIEFSLLFDSQLQRDQFITFAISISHYFEQICILNDKILIINHDSFIRSRYDLRHKELILTPDIHRNELTKLFENVHNEQKKISEANTPKKIKEFIKEPPTKIFTIGGICIALIGITYILKKNLFG